MQCNARMIMDISSQLCLLMLLCVHCIWSIFLFFFVERVFVFCSVGHWSVYVMGLESTWDAMMS